MSEIALYRKYRPDSFEKVQGQEHITDVLKVAVANKSFAHAYLFCGSRGTGKTSVARIFARALGAHEHDIIEIDAASNRGIDDVRELREGVNMLPFESPYKVYIVDEVHMLTKEAFNALLKTLEEPPKHVVFVLATTEMHKLPETILSRCQTFTFKKPSLAILRGVVTNAAKAEGVSIEKDAAETIALLADGSFRDALGTLQKVLTLYTKGKVTREMVEKVTGAPSTEIVNAILKGVHEGDAQSALHAVNEAAKSSIDMRVLLELVLHKLRAVLLLRLAPNEKAQLTEQFSDEDMALIERFAKEATKTISSKVLLRFLEAHSTKEEAIPGLSLELAIIDVCSNDNT